MRLSELVKREIDSVDVTEKLNDIKNAFKNGEPMVGYFDWQITEKEIKKLRSLEYSVFWDRPIQWYEVSGWMK